MPSWGWEKDPGIWSLCEHPNQCCQIHVLSPLLSWRWKALLLALRQCSSFIGSENSPLSHFLENVDNTTWETFSKENENFIWNAKYDKQLHLMQLTQDGEGFKLTTWKSNVLRSNWMRKKHIFIKKKKSYFRNLWYLAWLKKK